MQIPLDLVFWLSLFTIWALDLLALPLASARQQRAPAAALKCLARSG
jgi:hypothetical protein